jgi:hypothetical protein
MFRSRNRYQARAQRAGFWGRLGLRPFLLVGLAAVGLAVCVCLPTGTAVPAVVADLPVLVAQAPAGPGAAPAPAQGGSLDEPLRLATEAARAYQQVRDYTCTLVKQERIKGRMQEQNVIQLKFRQQPFSVYMRWLAPKAFAGQEVCYVHGRNNNMMRVRSSGVLGGFGFMSIAPNDPRALEHSRHIITETGFGNLITQLYQEWTRARQAGKAQVRLAEFQYDQKACTRVEIVYPERAPQVYCYRGVTYFDKQTHLPIRVEFYDWPQPGGPPEGELLESFSYAGLQLNVGLPDAVFNH